MRRLSEQTGNTIDWEDQKEQHIHSGLISEIRVADHNEQ
ncbi:hypothetical protein EC844_11629 [Acinetobacter calcoaceticus]|uniref:Uncharacterized protein n=1 Tax=Acinetobacter calcoaceticus TaxID=471 RepID=A0A4R1XN82_ACICA|nr:hypothetical protein EC844_11629 [Acinetobacter calcoaceticus]